MEELKKAIAFREKREFSKAENIFKELIKNHTENKNVHYQYAWLLDNLGKEKEAIKHYTLAIKYGLAGNELADCFLGLGSSYRMLKDYKKSIQVFLEAINIFPNNNELKLFLSFTYFDNNELKKAYSSLLILLTLVHKDNNLLVYKNAINSYLEKISI